MKKEYWIISLIITILLNNLFAQTVKVKIDAKKELSSVHELFFGLNVARWDESLFPLPSKDMLLTNDRDAIKKTKDANFKLLKYPGGNDADAYIWNDPKNNPSEMDTDEFAAFCKALGAEGFITVNFNQPPELAAEWVRYCNIKNNYAIKYWEVGDEQWGDWARGHTTPEAYAAKYVEFVKAMKNVDPTIKVAINVKMENDPDGWTVRSLKAAKDYVDLITITFYPVSNKQEDDIPYILSSPKSFIKGYLDVKDAVRSIFPKEKTKDIWVIPVGYNTVSGYPGTITTSIINALWVADLIGIMANLGVEQTDYWALHNAYPPRNGDYGLLSSDCSNTPTNNYYAIKLLSTHMKKFMVHAESSDTLLSVYASKDEKGKKLCVILINKDGKDVKNINIDLKSFNPGTSVGSWILNDLNKNVKSEDFNWQKSRGKYIIPPYSIVVLEFIDSNLKPEPKNLALNSFATVSSYSLTAPAFHAKSAVDGCYFTRWASGAWASKDGSDKQWIQLDLRKETSFNQIKIFWDKFPPIEYEISCSNDAKTWQKIYNGNNSTIEVDDIKFNPVSNRYIRIDFIKGKRSISTYNIKEIEIYNN